MDDNYISCWIHGGIGNQLFQIANAINYSEKTKKKLIFKNDTYLWNFHGLERKTAWNTLFSNKLNVITNDDYYKNIKFNEYKELRNNCYDEIPILENNVYLNGYFQSAKYISDNTKNKMNELIYSNEEFFNIAKMIYNIIKEYFNDANDDNYVFLHIRRTDYVQNCTHNLLSIEDYYNKALKEYFDENVKIVVFSDDIEWCKRNIKFKNCYFVDIRNLYIELILMSFYKNAIIANSTFSWWGAYTGNYKNKKVIAPKQWYANTSHIREWNDIYLDHWILI